MKIGLTGILSNFKRRKKKVKAGFISPHLIPFLLIAHSFNPLPACLRPDFGNGKSEQNETSCPQTYCNAPQYIKVALVNVFKKGSLEYGMRRLDCFNIEKEKIIVCMGGGTFPYFYVELFREELTPEMQQAISNYIFVSIPAAHFYDIDRNKLWMEKLDITPFSCAYVEDKDKIYCFGEKAFVYYDENITSFPPIYLYEYDYKTGSLKRTKTKLPTFAEIKKNFRKFGYCDQDKAPDSMYCVCDDEVRDYSYPSTTLCYSDSIYPGECLYVKKKKKIYCIGSIYGIRDPLDFIFEYDPFEDELKILDVRVKRTKYKEFIPKFLEIVHFPDIGKIIGTEGICDAPEYIDGSPSELCDRFFQSFPFFDYEKMETGFLNWRFPKSEKTGFSYFLVSNCVYSSLKRSIFCIGGEGLGLEELDSVVQFMPDGRARVVGSIYYAVNKWQDYEWNGIIIKKGDIIENGPWYELNCVEGYNKKIYCFGGFTSYMTGDRPALGTGVLEIDVSGVPDEW